MLLKPGLRWSGANDGTEAAHKSVCVHTDGGLDAAYVGGVSLQKKKEGGRFAERFCCEWKK